MNGVVCPRNGLRVVCCLAAVRKEKHQKKGVLLNESVSVAVVSMAGILRCRSQDEGLPNTSSSLAQR